MGSALTFLPLGLPRRVCPTVAAAFSKGAGGHPQLVAGSQVPMTEWPRCQSNISPTSGHRLGPPLNVTCRGCSYLPTSRGSRPSPGAVCSPCQFHPVRRPPDSSVLSIHLPPFRFSGCCLVCNNFGGSWDTGIFARVVCLQEMRDPHAVFHQQGWVP